jgi:thiamine pyrophosphate-dependent acetolactate synthase large subunit-like protein
MIDPQDFAKTLARHVTDEIVVAAYSSAFQWLRVADRPLNHFFFGAMGLASSHAIGLALGRPDKRVIVLDGDGSLLMNLGTLVTIGAVAPTNFTHFVCHNGIYAVNGSHPLPNPEVDLVGMARAAGIAKASRITELADFEARIAGLIKEPGPVFVDVAMGPAVPTGLDYGDMYSPARRAAFKAALKNG